MNLWHISLLLCLLFWSSRAKYQRFCRSDKHCNTGECCAVRQCRPLIDEGERCNIRRMIMDRQCPCVEGTACLLKETTRRRFYLKERRTCQRILLFDEEKQERVVTI